MKHSKPPFTTLPVATRRLLLINSFLSVGMLVAMAGCTSEPAYFRANLVEIEIEQDADEPVTADQQRMIGDTLLALFGNPDHPQNPFGDDEQVAKGSSPLKTFGFDLDKLRIAAGPVYRDAEGNQRGLYRLHCAHCHGITGDGGGPTAPFLNPYPRDYRQGVFKFKSTFAGAKPTRDDLKRVLHEGVAGTSMPSFKLLPDNEIEALLEYVKYLSVRGETEIKLIEYVAAEGEMPGTIALIAGGFPISKDEDGIPEEEPEEENIVASVVYKWDVAAASVIHPVTPNFDFEDPDQLQASIDRGRELFYSKNLQCNSCHGDSAQGDGQTEKYSAWFKWREDLGNNPTDSEKIEETVERFMEVGALRPRTIKPRNLRMGVLRGGRRPIDIYRRIFSGINGGPMPGHGAITGITGDDVAADVAGGTIARQQIWDVVNYVRSLPYETLSAEPADREGVGLRPR